MNRTWLKLQSAIHSFVYRKSGGRIGSYFGAPTLILTTIGRKSGRRRNNPLFYIEEGQSWFVAGANAGSDKHPSWWLNLQSNPDAQIQVKDKHIRVNAELVTGEDRERLWETFLQLFSGYGDYQEKTDREIPIVKFTSIV